VKKPQSKRMDGNQETKKWETTRNGCRKTQGQEEETTTGGWRKKHDQKGGERNRPKEKIYSKGSGVRKSWEPRTLGPANSERGKARR